MSIALSLSVKKDRQTETSSFMARSNATIFIDDYSQTLGSDDTKVYIVEFMDFACKTCADFAPFIQQMMTDNPGKIKTYPSLRTIP